MSIILDSASSHFSLIFHLTPSRQFVRVRSTNVKKIINPCFLPYTKVADHHCRGHGCKFTAYYSSFKLYECLIKGNYDEFRQRSTKAHGSALAVRYICSLYRGRIHSINLHQTFNFRTEKSSKQGLETKHHLTDN